jgi:hypothetical protein
MTSSARISDPAWCAQRLAEGNTVAAIATASNVSRQTASSWLKRHGLRANHHPYTRPDTAELAAGYQAARSIRSLAIRFGISASVMRTWLFEAGIESIGRPGRPALDIDLDDVRSRRARGDAFHKIGRELGVSAETLRCRLKHEPTRDPATSISHLDVSRRASEP